MRSGPGGNIEQSNDVRAGADFAALIGLWTLAVAQPLVDLLREDAAIGAATWSRPEILLLGAILVIVPPLALFALAIVSGRVHRPLRRYLHLVLVAALAGVFFAYVAKQTKPEAGPVILGAMVLGAAATALLYQRLPPFRTFVSVLAIAPILSLGVLATEKPIELGTSDAPLSPAPRNGPPVVFIVFDELPVTSLMDAKGNIDAAKVPNFARLVQDATWFRNATSVADLTHQAVPAILTGRYPSSRAALDDRPNLFTLLGRTYRFNVQEPTGLCREELCPDHAQATYVERLRSLWPRLARVSATRFLPRRALERIMTTPGLPDSRAELRAFARDIPEGDAPSLNYIHAQFPHSPWNTLPNGRQYSGGLIEEAALPFLVRDRATGAFVQADDTWTKDARLVALAHQAHLAQVGAADYYLGLILRRLRLIGAYDRALIVVTADHGAAFRPGYPFRRLTPTTAPEILGVPLFVKRPGSAAGSISDAQARSTDLLATVAGETGTPDPAGVGPSAFVTDLPTRKRLRARGSADDREWVFDAERLAKGRLRVAKRQAALFPTGEAFDFGPRRDLIGKPSGLLRRAGARRLNAQIDAAAELGAFDPAAKPIRSSISGRIDGIAPGAPIAIAVNGAVEATTWTYEFRGGNYFAALVRPSRLRRGANSVEILSPGPKR